MMRQDIKSLWVAALMSGEYVQGQKYLHKIDGSMCCFGVLTDLFLKAHDERWTLPHADCDHFDYKTNCSMPPQSVLDWAGIHSVEATRVRIGFTLSKLNLVTHNDSIPIKTFDQIAKAIEKQL